MLVRIVIMDVSRKEKTIFSSPFNSFKLGRNCANTAFHNHIKRIFLRHKKAFQDLKGIEIICKDKDCKYSNHLTLLHHYINAS